jgi:hypothetical protein
MSSAELSSEGSRNKGHTSSFASISLDLRSVWTIKIVNNGSDAYLLMIESA